jgi:AraC-like DNA-binding protein
MGAFEKHYSVKELSELWNFSENTIRRTFKDETGVLRKGRPETRFRRKHWTLSIPESVVMRVHQKISR